MNEATNVAVGAGVGLVTLVIGLAAYLFWSYLLKRICERAGGEPGILIWIPLLQFIPLLNAVGMTPLWVLGFLVPIVNLIGIILLWVNVHKKLGKNPWLTVLLFIPLVNFIYFLYLAFAND